MPTPDVSIDKAFDAISKRKEVLEQQIKHREGILRDLSQRVPEARMETATALAKIARDLENEKTTLLAQLDGLRIEVAREESRLKSQREDMQALLRERSERLNALIDQKQRELDALTAQVTQKEQRNTALDAILEQLKTFLAQVR